MRSLALLAVLPMLALTPPAPQKVDGGFTATFQRLTPFGQLVRLQSRPVDVLALGDGRAVVKTSGGIELIDLKTRQVLSKVASSSSHLGLIRVGTQILATNAESGLLVLDLVGDTLTKTRTVALPKPKIGGEAYGNGLADLKDGRVLVALSRSNSLGIVDLATGTTETIPVDIAPTAIALAPGGKVALVACWSRQAKAGEPTAKSAGTAAPVDARGTGTQATLCFVDLAAKKVVGRVPLGLQPNDIEVVGNKAFVACANADSIAVIDLAGRKRLRDIVAKPDPDLPFGSAPTAVEASADGKFLAVACGGNNAVGILRLSTGKFERWVPTEWYPVSLAQSGDNWLVANAKGSGSRQGSKGGYNVYQFTGSLGIFPASLAKIPAQTTQTVLKDALPNSVKTAMLPAPAGAKRVPVPAKVGDPSTIEHVVYVLKENRTYDQVFGDLKQGDGDPKLCIFPRRVTPNHHALAERYVLLDNFYCNGVLSADGHSWAMEGNATSYFERSFGGWTRSYPFGDDPLAFSSSGFLWDNVLRFGKSFRNYGEFSYSDPVPKTKTFKQVYDDFVAGRKQSFTQNIGVARVRNYSHKESPGWQMGIPDVVRAKYFLDDLKDYEKKGFFPNLTIVYLPQDHTSGTSAGMPTPEAHMADNDLALGQIVEGMSKSRFWKKTAIFVVEDDPQAGFDHVDGHRSPCLVISPYTKRKTVVSNFYNQTSVLHTMQRILGVPAMNQMDARSPLMSACFTTNPDFRSYTALPNQVPLDQLNPSLKTLKGEARKWAELSATIPDEFSGRRTAEHDDQLNRILWFAQKGTERYPAELAGAHGKGLAKRGLVTTGEEDDD